MIDPREHIGLAKDQTVKLYEKFKLRNIYEFEDIMQICFVSLVNASKNFDESKNVKFSTYACKCMHNDLYQYVERDKYYPLSKEQRIKNRIPLLSLDVKLNDETDIPFLDFVADTRENEDDSFNKLLIRMAINKLNDKQKKVIYLRYYKEKTQREIAKLLGVSQFAISRLERRALSRMKLYVS